MYTSRYSRQKAAAWSGPISSSKYSSISRGDGRPIIAEAEHIAFRLQPVAQIGAAQHQRVAASIHELGALRVNKTAPAMLGAERLQP